MAARGNKKSKATTALCVLLIILGAFLALGVKFLFHSCTADGMDNIEPACKSAENAVFVAGLIILALAVIQTAAKKRAAHMIVSLLIAALSVFAAVIPNNIFKLCQMPGMRCLTVMRPFVILMGIFTAAVALISFAVNLKTKQTGEY